VSVVLLGIKFTAFWLTQSKAILTDALESIVNVVAGAFALFSITFASQPRDENHPYGHGKIEFLSAGFEGGLILIAGISIIASSVYALFQPPVIHSLQAGAWISAAAGAVNYAMGMVLIRKGKNSNSLLMVASGKHLVSDTISSIGLVLGLILIIVTGLYWLDLVIAIIFGLVILVTGFGLVKKSVTSLLDEADYEKLQLLIGVLEKNRRQRWIDIHNLRVIKYGSNLHVDCHITLPWFDSLELTHDEVTKVEKLISTNLGHDVEFFIHADPCIMPDSCTVCQISDCVHRKAPFVKKVEWNASVLLPNRKHGSGS
jgi:cation diffusion facilitator family transporter